MSEHTKGPWRVHGGYGICVAPSEPIGPMGARTIVSCRQDWIPGKEQHANARLIAAAPELLEALIAMRKTMNDDQSEVSIQADAAIKKATGRS